MKKVLIEDLLINLAGDKITMTTKQVELLLKLKDSGDTFEFLYLASSYNLLSCKHPVVLKMLENNLKVSKISVITDDIFISHSMGLFKRNHTNFITNKDLMEWT